MKDSRDWLTALLIAVHNINLVFDLSKQYNNKYI